MFNKKNNFFYFLIIALLVNCFLASVSVSKETIFIQKKYFLSDDNTELPIISRQQLLTCLEKVKLAELDIKQLNEKENLMNVQKNNIEELKHELEINKVSLDFHRSESISAYNLLSQKLQQLSRDYNVDAEHYNHTVNQYHSEIKILKNQCNNKRFAYK